MSQTTAFSGQGRKSQNAAADEIYHKWVSQSGVVNSVKLEAMEIMLTRAVHDIDSLSVVVRKQAATIKRLQEDPWPEKAPALKASSTGKKAKPGPSSGSPTRKPVPSKT